MFTILPFFINYHTPSNYQTRCNVMNTNNTNNLLQTHRQSDFVAMIIQGVYEFLLSIQFEQNQL